MNLNLDTQKQINHGRKEVIETMFQDSSEFPEGQYYTTFQPEEIANIKSKERKILKPVSFYFCTHVLDSWTEKHSPHFLNSNSPSISSMVKNKQQPFVPFRLLKKIAKGSFGSVYECCVCCSTFTMAVKVIPKRKTSARAICQEVAISRLLTNKGLVHFYDVVEFHDDYLLFMEYVRAPDLFSWVQRQKDSLLNSFQNSKKKFPIESFRERIHIMKELVKIIVYLLTNKVVHRDLKLDNILYQEETKTLKLCDFGLATVLRERNQVLTESCGSVHYISPEVIRGHYDAETSTAWSLGVILYALFFGEYPFDGEDIKTVCDEIVTGKYQVKQVSDFYHLPLSGKSQLCEMNWLFDDLLRNLLCLDVKRRLTLDQIQQHPFFDSEFQPAFHSLMRLKKNNVGTHDLGFRKSKSKCQNLPLRHSQSLDKQNL